MKRYKRKKIRVVEVIEEPQAEQITPEPLVTRSISGDDLICPHCRAQGQMIIRAIERTYYRIQDIQDSNRWGRYSNWGDTIDSECNESWIICDGCSREVDEEEVYDVTIAWLDGDEEAEDEAI
jgi:hypothetical protein